MFETPAKSPAASVTGTAALLLTVLLPLGMALAAQTAPAATGPVAAMFPPWWDGARAFAAAGTAGPVIRLGAFPFVVIVAAADRARVHASGAWLLLDPALFGGCFTRRSTGS
jgi:hypothetical protein